MACLVATGAGALITALLSKAGGSPNDSFGAGVNRFADEIGQLIPLVIALHDKQLGSPNDSFGFDINRFADEMGQLIPLVIGEMVNAPCDCERAIEGRAVAERASAR